MEELQDVIFRKHVSLLETSISLISLVCLTHLHVMRLAALSEGGGEWRVRVRDGVFCCIWNLEEESFVCKLKYVQSSSFISS